MHKIITLSFIIFVSGSVYADNKCEQTLAFINIDPVKEEENLKKLGYTEHVFYAGLDALHEIIELGKYLKKHLKDPKTTHIENLVPLIDQHIDHIRKGLIVTHQRHKLTNLNTLRQEALIKVKNKQVTLYWWWLFNLRLAALATNFDSMDKYFAGELAFLKNHPTHDELSNYIETYKNSNNEYLQMIKKALNLFPKKVILPTISPLGILALNKAVKNNLKILPVELFNQTTLIDGSHFLPVEAYLHDIEHIVKLKYGTPFLPENPELQKRIATHIEQLPVNDRKKAEVICFILTHELFADERPTTLNQITDSWKLYLMISNSESIVDILPVFFKEIGSLDTRDTSHSTNAVKEKEDPALFNKEDALLEESVRIFTQTVRNALE